MPRYTPGSYVGAYAANEHAQGPLAGTDAWKRYMEASRGQLIDTTRRASVGKKFEPAAETTSVFEQVPVRRGGQVFTCWGRGCYADVPVPRYVAADEVITCRTCYKLYKAVLLN